MGSAINVRWNIAFVVVVIVVGDVVVIVVHVVVDPTNLPLKFGLLTRLSLCGCDNSRFLYSVSVFGFKDKVTFQKSIFYIT